MYSSEEITGKVKDIQEYWKKELVHRINDIDILDSDFECEGVEIVQNDINEILNMINGIYQDLIIGHINKDTIIECFYHPMGAWEYIKSDMEKCSMCEEYCSSEYLTDTEGMINGGFGYICPNCLEDMKG